MHPCNRILSINKNEPATGTSNTLDVSQIHYAEWKTRGRRSDGTYGLILFLKHSGKHKAMRMEDKPLVVRGWGQSESMPKEWQRQGILGGWGVRGDRIVLYFDCDAINVTRRPGFDPWRRKWQPTPVLLLGKSHGWRSLVGYSPCGRKESDTTEWLHFNVTAFVKTQIYIPKKSVFYYI